MQAPKARRDLPRRMKGTTMKAIYLTTIALLTTFAVPALADTKVVQGCEVTDMGGYSNKVDPTCQFNHNPGGNDGANSGLTLQDVIDALNGLG